MNSLSSHGLEALPSSYFFLFFFLFFIFPLFSEESQEADLHVSLELDILFSYVFEDWSLTLEKKAVSQSCFLVSYITLNFEKIKKIKK